MISDPKALHQTILAAIGSEISHLHEISRAAEELVGSKFSHLNLTSEERRTLQNLDRLTQGLADLSILATSLISASQDPGSLDPKQLSDAISLGQIREEVFGSTHKALPEDAGSVVLF